MRPETARKMSRAIWMQRARSYGPTLALVLGCAVLGIWLFGARLERADPTVALTQLNGTIVQAERVAGRVAMTVAHIKLDDGREVDADSLLAIVLKPQERVIVSEAQYASGKVSFHVLQVLN